MEDNGKGKRSRTARAPALARKRARASDPDAIRGCSEAEALVLIARLREQLDAEQLAGRANRLRDAIRLAERINIESLGRSWTVHLHSCLASLSHGSLRQKTTALLKLRRPAHLRTERLREDASKLERDPNWGGRDSFELAQELAYLPDVEALDRAEVKLLHERIRKECAWLDSIPRPEGGKIVLRLQTSVARCLCGLKKGPDAFSLDEAIGIVRLPKDAGFEAFRSGLQHRLDYQRKREKKNDEERDRRLLKEKVRLQEHSAIVKVSEKRYQLEDERIKEARAYARIQEARKRTEDKVFHSLRRRIDDLPGSEHHKALLCRLSPLEIETMLRPAPSGVESLAHHGLVSPSRNMEGWYDFTEAGWSFHNYLVEHVAPLLHASRREQRQRE